MKFLVGSSLLLGLIFFVPTESGSADLAAQNVDCSSIKNNPASRKRCEDGVKEARKWEKEKKKQRRRAALRDGICIADAIGGDVAAYAAGWKGKVVYKGTRAAADAISRGASSCPK